MSQYVPKMTPTFKNAVFPLKFSFVTIITVTREIALGNFMPSIILLLTLQHQRDSNSI
jgi:hypothetical protein